MQLPETAIVLAQSVISILAIVNPLGGLPAFIGITDYMESDERKHVFHIAALVALAIIVIMALLGQILLASVFHIDINEFRFAGGLLLMLVGIKNIMFGDARRRHAKRNDIQRLEDNINMAISPIAIPMLSGPGTIVTVMLLAGQNGRLITSISCVVSFIVVLAILHWSDLFYRLMGRVGTRAMGRIMQIFLVAIGVKFCFASIAAFVKSL